MAEAEETKPAEAESEETPAAAEEPAPEAAATAAEEPAPAPTEAEPPAAEETPAAEEPPAATEENKEETPPAVEEPPAAAEPETAPEAPAAAEPDAVSATEAEPQAAAEAAAPQAVADAPPEAAEAKESTEAPVEAAAEVVPVKESPDAAPQASQKTSPKTTPKTTPKTSPKTSPEAAPSPKTSPKGSTKGSPETASKTSPKTTPKSSPETTAATPATETADVTPHGETDGEEEEEEEEGHEQSASESSDEEEEAAEEMDAVVHGSQPAGLKPAPVIQSGMHLERDVLLSSLKEVQTYLQTADADKQTDPAFIEKLNAMVAVLNADMTNLRAYCERAQEQLESVRLPMKELTDRIFNKIQPPVTAAAAAAAEGEEAGRTRNLEELQVELQQKTVQQHLARINDELLKMSKIATETESAVLNANQACIEATEAAKLAQEQFEEQRKLEEEEKAKLEEEMRIEEAKRKEEEERLLEEERKEQELIKQREKEANEWPWHTFDMESKLEFDGGVMCVARSDPMYFKPEEQLRCQYVSQVDTDFEFHENEELVGHFLQLEADIPKCKCPITICIPHCMPRQQLSTREPVVRAETEPGVWTELRTNEIQLEKFKDLRFAQTEVKRFTRLVVTSRFRRDLIKLKKRGGRSVSKVDPRVTFQTLPDTFSKKEKVIVQMQPVDVVSMNELKRVMPEAKGLLCAGSVINLEWTPKTFGTPIVMTLPIPANPVVLKKAAAAQAAKEAKEAKEAKNREAKEAKAADDAAAKEESAREDKPKKDDTSDEAKDDKKAKAAKAAKDEKEGHEGQEAKEAGHEEGATGADEGQDKSKDLLLPPSWLKPVKWFMGQYVKESDDERDLLYFMRKKPGGKSKWSVEQMDLQQIRLDAVELTLKEPVDTFLIMRTSILVTEREVEKMTNMLDSILSHRLVTMILKQLADDPCDVRMYVVPSTKKDKLLKKLADDGYDQGPEPSDEFPLQEGDPLDIAFRGNVKCVDENPKLRGLFNTNIETTFEMRVRQHDVFVQKSYDVYRGFVQLRKVTKIVPPPEKDKKAGPAGAAAMAVSPLALAPVAAPHPEGSVAVMAVEGDPLAPSPPADTSAIALPIAVAPAEPPPPPAFEIKMVMMAELLITFPKDPDMMSAKPLAKTPITYHPTNEPLVEEVIAKVASTMGPEWPNVASSLGVTRASVQMLQRNAMLLSKPAAMLRQEMLMMWVKTLPKSADKCDLLAEALTANGRDDIVQYLKEVKLKFEPGPNAIGRIHIEDNGKVSRGVMAVPGRR